MALKRELGEQCVKSATTELGKKQGTEFDQCYMTHQMMMHQHMLDTLTVFSRHASPELQAVLREGQQTTQQHLTHAKEIFDRLDQDRPAATARRPGAEPAPRDR
jgi:predicted outer membrane protein